MNPQQWQQPSRSTGGAGDAGGGSVKRARERVEAGLPPEIQPPPPRPSRTYDPSRSGPAPMDRSRPQMPPALATSRNGQGPIGVAISRPTQVPQWPLVGTIEGPDPKDPRTNQQYQPPPGRTIPPQRPPRPSHVPSLLDASRLQEHTPSFQYQPQQYQPERGQARGSPSEDEYGTSPFVTSPMTQSSRPSTTSSVGTIPDFPVPMPAPPPIPPMPQRRSINLGPPPSSRRGASSYYSQTSFVSPIPEESPRTQPSHASYGSYASSAAIPSTWGSDSPGGYHFDDEYDDEDGMSPRDLRYDVIEEGHESRQSNMDDNDDRGLIRSASLGKRAKPSMITTKSSDKVDPRSPAPPQPPLQTSKLERMGVLEGVTGAAMEGNMTAARMRDGQRETVWPMAGDSPPRASNGLAQSPYVEPTLATALTTDEAVVTRTPPEAMRGGSNVARSLQPGEPDEQLKAPNPGYLRLSAIRRPPRLDIDAVRDAEARGSLTSLPDLIRRATRLAAMMDRGKRPASRFNDLNDFPMPSDDKEADLSSTEKRRSGLSGMLAAFPAAGAGTPRDTTPRPTSSWPSPFQESNRADSSDPQPREKKGRRCCGLPCWAFLLVVVILLIIIAAAVVIPLEFLVLRKPSAKSAPALSDTQQCAANPATSCQNDGSTIIDEGSCACICTNGFTGATCSIAGSTGCTTTSLSGSNVNNVTVGEAIPRLISGALTNFSVPLSENTILARLNLASLSCSTENALVTFDNQPERVDTVNEVVTVSVPDSSSAAPATTSSAAAPISTSVFVTTDETLDFARVAVLYVLQQESLANAEDAQVALEKVFTANTITDEAARNVSLSNGNSINLVGFSVDVGNGTVGTRSNSISRRFHARRRTNI